MIQTPNQANYIKKSHFYADHPNKLEIEFTSSNIKILIENKLRLKVDYKFNGKCSDLIRTRLEFGGGF